MKKLFRILLLACLILLLGTSAVLAQDEPLLIQPAPSASDISLEQKPAFVTISIPYERPDDLGWPDSEHLFLRYVDDQSIIPLSVDYDGRFWATIPAQYAEREVEAFVAQELEFTDYDPYYFEFYSMNELAVTGIVRGNEKGEALPFENISRAEAVTMLVRMLGLENASAAAANFGDVPADAWYAKNVAIAAAYGIIKGDGTNFFPLREVSREEFVTMTARALWQTGLFIEPENAAANDIDQICNIKDGADVADWAGSAYLSMKTDIITGRTMSFCVLGLSQLVHSFNMRSNTKSVLKGGITENKILLLS